MNQALYVLKPLHGFSDPEPGLGVHLQPLGLCPFRGGKFGLRDLSLGTQDFSRSEFPG